MVRNMRAVLKKASCGTRRIFRSIRCKKQASVVRKGYSVPETAPYGTGHIFIRRHSVPERPPTVRGASSVRRLFSIAACGTTKEKSASVSLAGRFYAQYFIKPANGIKQKKGMQKNCIPIINSRRQSNHNYLISIRRVA